MHQSPLTGHREIVSKRRNGVSGPAFRMHRLGDSLTVCDESVVHAPEMIAHRPGKWASHLAGYLPKRSKRGEKIAGGVKNLDGRLTRSGWPRGMDTGCRGTSRDLATFRLAKLGTTVFHQRETELRTPGITNHHGYDASSRFSFQRIFVPGIYRFSRRVISSFSNSFSPGIFFCS